MNKEECVKVVELLSVTWDKQLDAASLGIRVRGFWEYIQDLPYEPTMDTIRKLGVAGRRWAPKPGELRLLVLSTVQDSPLPPEPEEAWMILQDIGGAIYNGTVEYEKPHPLVAKVIKRIGDGAIGLKTNADRTMFITLYEKMREDYLLENYAAD